VEIYRDVVKALRDKCETKYPVSIQRVKLADSCHGYCQLKNKKFLIRINRDLDVATAIDTLIHELAHAIAWDAKGDIHGTEWGKAYSKVYRLYLKECIEK
jgi:Zn-dependent peptidase ImmA (M78 family)